MGDLLEESSRRVETLLDRFGSLPPVTGARTDAEELVRVLATLHGECLRRICAALTGELGDRAPAVLERCCSDPLVASLFVTHGLHPIALDERVRRAIADIPEAKLVSASEELVEIRMSGSASIVPAIERAVYVAAPEVLDVRVTGQTISLLEAI